MYLGIVRGATFRAMLFMQKVSTNLIIIGMGVRGSAFMTSLLVERS